MHLIMLTPPKDRFQLFAETEDKKFGFVVDEDDGKVIRQLGKQLLPKSEENKAYLLKVFEDNSIKTVDDLVNKLLQFNDDIVASKSKKKKQFNLSYDQKLLKTRGDFNEILKQILPGATGLKKNKTVVKTLEDYCDKVSNARFDKMLEILQKKNCYVQGNIKCKDAFTFDKSKKTVTKLLPKEGYFPSRSDQEEKDRQTVDLNHIGTFERYRSLKDSIRSFRCS